MKIEYEICDVCKEKLPNLTMKNKIKKVWNYIFWNFEYESYIKGVVDYGKEKTTLCNSCFEKIVDFIKNMNS